MEGQFPGMCTLMQATHDWHQVLEDAPLLFHPAGPKALVAPGSITGAFFLTVYEQANWWQHRQCHPPSTQDLPAVTPWAMLESWQG